MTEPRDETEQAMIAAITAAIELERDEGVVAASIAAAIERECDEGVVAAAIAAAIERERDEGVVAAAIAAALAAGAFAAGVAVQPPADAAGFWTRAAMAREWPSPVALLRRC